jgi:hypothetical protein
VGVTSDLRTVAVVGLIPVLATGALILLLIALPTAEAIEFFYPVYPGFGEAYLASTDFTSSGIVTS